MSTNANGRLDSLIHDMNSKCSSLKTAVTLLRTASPEEIKELLTLMKQQASSIAEDIGAYQSSVGVK